jgi:hypothetical protein
MDYVRLVGFFLGMLWLVGCSRHTEVVRDDSMCLSEVTSNEPYVRCFVAKTTSLLFSPKRSSLDVYIDGRIVGLCGAEELGSNVFRISWNTLGTQPGIHQLNVGFSTSSTNPNVPSMVIGPCLQVTNDAPLWYDYSSQVFGSRLRVAGRTASKLDYEIQIRNTAGALLKTITGTTDDSGLFEQFWDLTPDGNSDVVAADVLKVSLSLKASLNSSGQIVGGYPVMINLPDYIRSKN